jgi:hypothetical protein
MSLTHPSENTIASLQTILDAIKTGNYELFLTVGDSDYKAGISKEMFDSVSTQLSPRITVLTLVISNSLSIKYIYGN